MAKFTHMSRATSSSGMRNQWTNFFTVFFPVSSGEEIHEAGVGIIGLLLTKKRCQRGLLARLGKVPAPLRCLSGPVVWVHAVSLGEVTAIVPLLKAMKKEDPCQEIIVSTVTETQHQQRIIDHPKHETVT